jgi:hypothetical protein
MAAVTVATGFRLGGIASTIPRTSNQKIHEVDDNLYLCAVEASDADPQMFKSTDSGATWSNVDAANAPNGFSGAAEQNWNIDTEIHGGVIHVLYRSAATTLAVARFNTATDLWTTSLGDCTTASPVPYQCSLAIRSDGDVLVFHTDSAEQNNILYDVYEGVSWSSGNAFLTRTGSLTAYPLCAVMDSADICHVFFLDPGDGTHYSWLSIDGSNTLGDIVDIDTGTSVNVDRTMAANFLIYDVAGTDTVLSTNVTANDDLDANVVTLEAASAAGGLAAQTSDIHTGTDLGENILATFRHNNVSYIFWSEVDDSDILYISNNGSGWGTAASNQTTWKTLTGPTALGHVGPLLGGVGATYYDNGNVYFDWFIAPPGFGGGGSSRIRSQFELRPY